VQIDLLIDRRDQVINLCEIKFSVALFTITKKYATNLAHKIMVFKEETQSKKAIHLTMITAKGLQQNNWAENLVQNNLSADILFMYCTIIGCHQNT